ncbi:YggS family pyridoxal phosphate-dependent enzyme [Marinilabilia rubra]|uniref:Pyridoxal phosphate homeostasis protein n=1 Tax=Marinilabilia rubra TaxID=2162893 RepID=A0A2U2B6H0_9BACT|nr:YggS family pyridoxal phosphate-dependent enzyme [Marinilabilia rubra]PWD98671.1 YggS family pyridoxal phosphate-dependent enzyme [Marinilabilia rubra]
MSSVSENLKIVKDGLPEGVTLVAVSKTKPAEMIMEAYESGQSIFGENKARELADKYEELPKDIDWHMIGHLQRNKVKYIAPFVSLIHGVDSMRLLRAINKEGAKNDRVIPCLLQIHIASEESKFGLDAGELTEMLKSDDFKSFDHVKIQGLMGMATFTDDESKVASEFGTLKKLFDETKQQYFTADSDFSILSMGMSGDYKIALAEGSNMVRIGSSIFGARNYQ